MDSKIAVNIGVAIGIFVFGGVFFTLASKGDGFTGLISGVLIGAVSGLMGLGLISPLINKDDEQINNNNYVDAKLPDETEKVVNENLGFFMFENKDEAIIPPAFFGYWVLGVEMA